ncbi:hypothetical protein GCM10023165_25180 [Variovorax defluvii]|uniref:Ferric uptake regulation protein n=1 Tax=Variovorax defluvii TaxID=913761 RepID=A0ABP8HRC4_9BURK
MTPSTGKPSTRHTGARPRTANATARAPRSRVLLTPVPDAGKALAGAAARSKPHPKPKAPMPPLPPLDRIATEIELVELINARLRPASSRRVGLPHAALLRTLDRMEDGAGDVPSIYKALMDGGEPMAMSKVYRVLKVLEEAGVVERRWMLYDGRPRSQYRILRA